MGQFIERSLFYKICYLRGLSYWRFATKSSALEMEAFCKLNSRQNIIIFILLKINIQSKEYTNMWKFNSFIQSAGEIYSKNTRKTIAVIHLSRIFCRENYQCYETLKSFSIGLHCRNENTTKYCESSPNYSSLTTFSRKQTKEGSCALFLSGIGLK